MSERAATKEFENKSIEFQKKISKTDRSSMGVFYTPKSIRNIVFNEINKYPTPKNILEPTCGSGEFLIDCEQRYDKAIITGVELDSRSADLARELTTRSDIITKDFMEWKSDTKYDLIIGNPPYVVRPTGFVHNPDIVTCRSNVCVEVMYKCITEHLSPEGLLAMVIPSSILKSKFYAPTLDLIKSSMDIVSLCKVKRSNFLGTNVKVVVIVMKKRMGEQINDYIFSTSSGLDIINSDSKELKALALGRRTLGSLPVKITFGIVIHTLRDFYVDRSAPGSFPIICHNDIVGNDNKTQYISSSCVKKRFSGRAILIARGYGHGDYTLRYKDKVISEFIIENHVIAITSDDDRVLDMVSKSFSDERTLKFCKLLCDSGDISKTYLKEIPIFE